MSASQRPPRGRAAESSSSRRRSPRTPEELEAARVEALLELGRSVDAERAAWALRELGAQVSGEALALGVALAAAYPALARELVGEPSLLTRLVEGGLSGAREREALLATLASKVGEPRGEAFLPSLRRAARDERARIAARELLPVQLGGADVDTTSRELAVLASVTLELALLEARTAVEDRLGPPRTSEGREARFVVLGMGKLGGGELNAGSDVDLIYLYDTDDGEARRPDGSCTSLHEFWGRVAKRLTASLEEPGDGGMLWRVDLRLRPEGRTGALVNSLAAAERYYESFGRLWERAALLRASPVAGDLALGSEILDALSPFVWRRRVDPTLALEMTALTRRARAELSADAARDLKLGVGGIREVEFFVQTLQLVWGGKDLRLRVPGTLEALRRLRASGYVSHREAKTLSDAWFALRRAEHVVQTASGLQTHELPRPPEEAERLARSLGFVSREAFLEDLEKHRAGVSAQFASLLPPDVPAPSRWTEVLDALDRGELQAFSEALQRELPSSGPEASGAGPSSTSSGPSPLARSLFELGRRPDGLLGARSREGFPALASTLLDAIADAADPEQAARFLRAFFSRLRNPGVYVGLLAQDAHAIARLVEMLGASAFVGEALSGHPELGDLVFARSLLPTGELARREVERCVQALSPEDEPEEGLVGALRRSRLQVVLEVALADLAGELGVREATGVLSALAEVQLEVATRVALGTPEGEAPRGLAVIGMGKLGGRELGYGSDLDVFFLYDAALAPEGADPSSYFTRCARKIIRLISVSHPAGPGYELDTRLRPSGSQGLLVTSLGAFARYHGHASEGGEGGDASVGPSVRAATWERMALLRARFVAGDAGLGERAIAIARATAYAPVDDEVSLVSEVHRLRLRMERELSQERPGRHDLKLGRGGLVDLEFVVQVLQMLHGGQSVVRSTETLGALEGLAFAGALSAADFATLREAYGFLRLLEQRIRVVHADASHLLEENAPGLAPLARRMGLRGRGRSEAASELLGRYAATAERVREVYDRLVGLRALGSSQPSVPPPPPPPVPSRLG